MVMVNTSRGDRSLRSLIDTENGTVDRELYVNPDIFAQELEQIFRRCWLFLGHERLVPNPGDFVLTRMGTEEILLVRDRKDLQIRAFLNSCRHRGEKVCRYDQGNALVFTCPFHAWTYDATGQLVGAAGTTSRTRTPASSTASGASRGSSVQELLRNAVGDLGQERPVVRGIPGPVRRERAVHVPVERRGGQRARGVHAVAAVAPADQLEGAGVHLLP